VSAAILTEMPTSQGQGSTPNELLYRITVPMYHEMIDAGILGTDDRVELLEGVLIRKMSKNTPRTISAGLLHDILITLPLKGWYLGLQDPVVTQDSEPEPDFMLVRGQREDYDANKPAPKDVGLVIEVSDASLSQDQGSKKKIYARAGIVIYWILNIPDRRIEVYTDPKGPVYQSHQFYDETQSVPVVLDGQPIGSIPVKNVLPKATITPSASSTA